MHVLIHRLNAALSGRYAAQRALGEGGMATVLLARDLRHDRDVAIKVLRSELAEVIGKERFLAEIRTTANLRHPHILPLFDSGEAGGLLFYVMPLAEGETLRARLERERQLPVADALRIATEVADALAGTVLWLFQRIQHLASGRYLGGVLAAACSDPRWRSTRTSSDRGHPTFT